jgi:hypothetical protein
LAPPTGFSASPPHPSTHPPTNPKALFDFVEAHIVSMARLIVVCTWALMKTIGCYYFNDMTEDINNKELKSECLNTYYSGMALSLLFLIYELIAVAIVRTGINTFEEVASFHGGPSGIAVRVGIALQCLW